MNANRFTENDLKQLAFLAAKLLMSGNNTMAEVSIDPQKMFNLPGRNESAGKLMVVVAGGESIQTLKSAMALAKTPQ